MRRTHLVDRGDARRLRRRVVAEDMIASGNSGAIAKEKLGVIASSIYATMRRSSSVNARPHPPLVVVWWMEE
jgi:hypothetical protein